VSPGVTHMKRTLRDAATAVGGQLVGEDHPYAAVATDSRTLQPGALFVALLGPTSTDGTSSRRRRPGAIGAIVEQAVPHELAQSPGSGCAARACNSWARPGGPNSPLARGFPVAACPQNGN